MAKFRLGDLVDEISERENNPASSPYTKFVGLEHYVTGEVQILNFGKTDNLASAMKIFKSGDTLVARRNVYLKRASVANFDGLTSGDSIVLRAKSDTFGKILPFLLNTEEFWDYADMYADGTMSKRLSPKILLNYELDLPNETELNKIADTLWAGERTRQAYKKLLQKTDDMVKAKFEEMFGNTAKCHLSDMADISAGQSSPHDEEFSETGTPFIKAGNLEDLKLGSCTESDCNLVSEQIVKTKKLKLHKKGTVLVAKSGMSCLSGHIYTLKTSAYVVSHLACIEYKKTISFPEYIKAFFDVTGVKKLIKDPSYPSIQLSQFSEMEIPEASYSEQEIFANFAQQAEQSKQNLQKSLNSLNSVMRSLVNQNFNKGE